MQAVWNIAVGVLAETWAILTESSPYILLGFAVAAILRAFVPDEVVARHLGQNRSSSVFKAALLGIPIPLCSCGVIPAAMSLRRQGASRGATSSFLISTPETGVDSIAITYALMDPVMTVFRPLAAMFTAVVAGLLERHLNNAPEEEAVTANQACDVCGCNESHSLSTHPLRERLPASFRYVFGEFLADVGKWLIVGLVIAGVISFLIPEDFLARYLGGGILPMLVMLAAGIPLYICATSSTPVAAALVLKGLSPGAALVFLLAGPATNAATMTVVAKFLGRRSLVIYLASIAASALALGWVLDLLYRGLHMDVSVRLGSAKASGVAWVEIVCSAVLLALIANSILLEGRKGKANKPH